jgi:hypothetical protein
MENEENKAMVELKELSQQTHQDTKVTPGAQLAFAKNQQIMRIRVNEVPQAITSFPVIFTRNGHNGSWVLSILTGLADIQNTFVKDEQWSAIFQPSAMQTHPLYLMQSASNKDTYSIGINDTNEAVNLHTGQSLFDDKGQPSLYLSRTKAMLEASIQHDLQTQEFIKTVEDLDLLKAIDLHISFASGVGQKLAGLYVLDESKLKQLSGEQLAQLNAKSYLVPMHAMLASLHQINALIRNNNELDPDNKIVKLKMEVAKDFTAL